VKQVLKKSMSNYEANEASVSIIVWVF